MRTHRIAGAVLATALLTGTIIAPAALAAPPAATASVAQSAVPFTQATATRTANGGHTLAWASPAGSVTVTAVTSPDATTGTALGTAPGSGSLTVAPGTLPEAGRWYFRLVPDSGSPLVVADRSAWSPPATSGTSAATAPPMGTGCVPAWSTAPTS